MPSDAESAAVARELRTAAVPGKDVILSRFFKTGPGEYAEGDRFLGVVVPEIRKVAARHGDASRETILTLLSSPFHEERLAGLLIMVRQYANGDTIRRQWLFDTYLSHTGRINNWDLVDLTAPRIVGEHLKNGNRDILRTLALSVSVWERRIAMLSTFQYIYAGDSRDALEIARMLVADRHDLIHKAVGWMLREVGKRCSLAEERTFLDEFAGVMPRTMLRYAIERFPDPLKRHYMDARARAL
jgi:3-methyladenine DNA glycosylase AlkD